MNLFGVMSISGSALRAERVRAEVVASNMANAETTRTADGGSYRRQHVVLQSTETNSFANALQNNFPSSLPLRSTDVAGGVQVAAVQADDAAALKRYDPSHPDANEEGFVEYPDINPLTEMVDLMGATRSYGLNASALQAEKGMLVASLDLLK